MGQCFEVVRFRPKAGREEEVVRLRGEMEEAFKREYPGLVSVTLARLEDGLWADVFVWESREEAHRAQETEHDLPEFARWVANVEELVSHDVGEVVSRR